MRCLFAGTPAVALPALRALLESRHEVIGVITRPDAPSGRGRRLTASPVAELARGSGIRVLTPGRLAEPETASMIRDLAPDACPVVAYGGLVPADLLSAPTHGWINLHFSLLPAWRGAAPVPWAIRAGDSVTGVSVFRIEEGLDTGPVYAQRSSEIGDRDTAGDLLERLARIGADLLVSTLDAIASGTATAVPQSSVGVSTAPRLRSEDARIDWRQAARTLDRFVRAMTPAPGAWTTLEGPGQESARRLMVGPVLHAGGAELPPGEVRLVDGAVWVGTGSTAVQLGLVQPAGRRSMQAGDWLRGLRTGTDPVRLS